MVGEGRTAGGVANGRGWGGRKENRRGLKDRISFELVDGLNINSLLDRKKNK